MRVSKKHDVRLNEILDAASLSESPSSALLEELHQPNNAQRLLASGFTLIIAFIGKTALKERN